MSAYPAGYIEQLARRLRVRAIGHEEQARIQRHRAEQGMGEAPVNGPRDRPSAGADMQGARR